VNGPADAPLPRPAAGADRTELEQRLNRLRRELGGRDEDLSGEWVEETASALQAGERAGWFDPASGGGIAFFARRGPSAFGHLHAENGVGPARSLAVALVRGLPPDVRTLSLGFTGLSSEEERTLVAELARTPGSTVIDRQAMERPLSLEDSRFPTVPPPGTERLGVEDVTVEALAELDRAAFSGTVDELLLGAEPDAHRRSVEALLEGRLGRFLSEASVAVVEPDPTRLVGAVLTAERSTRTALVLDLMVDPARRRRGVGTFLLGWTLRALCALGYEAARLWVSSDNEAALAMYRRFGFRKTLEATIYRWDRPVPSPQPHASR
jgi:ribosomal protein S18 acetylase RimI-like enzyme